MEKSRQSMGWDSRPEAKCDNPVRLGERGCKGWEGGGKVAWILHGTRERA